MNHKNNGHGYMYTLEETTKTYKKNKERFSRDILKHILRFCKITKPSLMEIGPGLGHFALECQSKGIAFLGIEPSTELRKELKKMEINVLNAFVPPIPGDDKSFDIVYASMLLEHLPTHNEASLLCTEVARVLKEGGLFCTIVPNYLTCKDFFFEMDYQHSFITTKRRVSKLLLDAGLYVIDVQHVIGWFWVKSNVFLNILRHLTNIAMVSVHWPFTTWFCEYLGLGDLLWKIRKTFFESLIIVAKKK